MSDNKVSKQLNYENLNTHTNFNEMIDFLIRNWQHGYNPRLFDYIVYKGHLKTIRDNFKKYKHVEITADDWFDIAKNLEN
jgi:hypothetical protein